MTASRPASRLLFLDNVRYLMVLVVVTFHVSAGYSGYNEFYQEPEGGGPFELVRNLVSAVPTMQLLFFVAGYFALPSLRHRSYGGFIRRKLWQLGVPWLLCVVFLGPIMPYLGYYSQSFNGLASDRYADFWSRFIASGFDGWFTHVAFTTNPDYHQMHWWFLSVLLQFFVLFALAHAVWTRWGKPGLPAVRLPSSVTAELFLVAAAMAVVRALGYLVDLPFGTFAFFFHELGASLFNHGPFFALGIFAFARGWFVERPAPGLVTFASLFGAVAGIAAVFIAGNFLWGNDGPRPFYMVFGALGESLWVLWWMVIIIGLTHRFMNRPSPVNAFLAGNSFVVYLIHYPLILVIRLFLLPWAGPAWVKWPLVLALALLLSHLLSQYLIRPFTRSSAILLVGINVALCLFGLPRTAWSHLLLDRQPELAAVVPAGRPSQVLGPQPETPDGNSRATPTVRASWQAGSLYVAARPRGLILLSAEGAQTTLADSLELAAIAPLTDSSLVAVEPETRRVLALDGQGRQLAVLADSTDSTRTPVQVIADGRGGVYFTARPREEGDGSIWYRAPDSDPRPVVQGNGLARPAGLALSADGHRLFVNDAKSAMVTVFTVAPDGALNDPRPFAELFVGNARYGRAQLGRLDPGVEGMTTDRDGRLFVTTKPGVQVFSPEGRLLGVVTFPDLPVDWRPKRPLSCAFGGPEMATLYVACGDEIFAVSTRTTGFLLPAQ